jgi:3-carboxy-cis,cis-muconate cycloisomerase
LRIAAGAAANAAHLAATLHVSPEAMAANLRLTNGAIVSERVNVVLAPLLGKANAKHLLAEVTTAAERDGTDVADLLAAALEQAGVAAPNMDGLFDPFGYTGMSGPLVYLAIERFEKVVARQP